jgi:hypothetical protein
MHVKRWHVLLALQEMNQRVRAMSAAPRWNERLPRERL